MTIKEIEVLTGMSRANIRFYEKEGLLAPTRNENGYRVYSQDDVQTLKRIKLLRLMHISLDEIKKMHLGEEKLSSVLDRQIESLGEKEEDMELAFESFQFSKGGVNAVCEIKYKGYDKDEGDVTIYPKEDVKSTSYSFCFRISK